ncbi:MAG: phosphoribosylformylglycinamidine cyclo-ligase [Deltaproteobacteria bacterium]|nr:phosphoribosylformylglycinamidine cyclo-ligase [Deltaproteobacteria bacterium]
MTGKKLTYKDAGVDIDAGEAFVRAIAPMVKTTFGPEVMTGLGGFGGLFALEPGRYREPVLVSGTDGVGTKLKLAFLTGRHDTIGIDLVAMCVNDILVSGARPLFFLDYLATGRLKVKRSADVVKGIVEGCRQAGCALIGGETAEMPDFYGNEEYDLAGFAVGVVERSRIIDGSAVVPGDQVLGLASTGIHSNGYSLVRKIVLDRMGVDLNREAAPFDRPYGEVLLEPTEIYVKTVLPLLDRYDLKGLSHITGGGLPGNLPRVLPEGCTVELQRGSWEIPPVFPWLAGHGHVPEEEMYRTFNMGIGFVLIVSPEDAQDVLADLEELGTSAWKIGEIRKGKGEVHFR